MPSADIEAQAKIMPCQEAWQRIHDSLHGLIYRNTLIPLTEWNYLDMGDRIAFRHFGLCEKRSCQVVRDQLARLHETKKKGAAHHD